MVYTLKDAEKQQQQNKLANKQKSPHPNHKKNHLTIMLTNSLIAGNPFISKFLSLLKSSQNDEV